MVMVMYTKRCIDTSIKLDASCRMLTRCCLQVIEKELAWQRVRQMADEGAYMTVKVESARPAGLIAKVFDSIMGFIPGSHVLEVGFLRRATAPCGHYAHWLGAA